MRGGGRQTSLAIGMFGLLADRLDQGRVSDASELASQHLNLLESIGDATLTVELSYAGNSSRPCPLRWGMLCGGHSSPSTWLRTIQRRAISLWIRLALAVAARGAARYWLGLPGWREDLDDAWARARTADALSCATVGTYKVDLAIPSDGRSVPMTARYARNRRCIADLSSNQATISHSRQHASSMGFALIHHDTLPTASRGVALLEQVRDQIRLGSQVYAWRSCRCSELVYRP